MTFRERVVEFCLGKRLVEAMASRRAEEDALAKPLKARIAAIREDDLVSVGFASRSDRQDALDVADEGWGPSFAALADEQAQRPGEDVRLPLAVDGRPAPKPETVAEDGAEE